MFSPFLLITLFRTFYELESLFFPSPVLCSLPFNYLQKLPNMQNMTRRFGRMTTKSSADDSQIAVLLKDFDDADMLLGKVNNVTPKTFHFANMFFLDCGVYPSLA
jgi:hypothetical protein